jgi:ABC-2 type transport system permease protein
MTQPAVRIEHLTKTYRPRLRGGEMVAANRDISFTIERGEVFGLLGQNGAGKTTLVMQLLGLVTPTSGHIEVLGYPVPERADEAKRLLGFLPQDSMAMQTVEVDRALRYTGCLRGQSSADARRQAEELFERLGLGAHRDRLLGTLSGGVNRMVSFAMALMGRPQMVILDEPTNALDPENRRLVWDALRDLHRAEGLTCLLVTHNLIEAERVLDRVAVIQEGQLIGVGTPLELRSDRSRQLHVEAVLTDLGSLSSAERVQLSTLGEVRIDEAERKVRLTAAIERASDACSMFLTQLGPQRVEDFRVVPPTLEDVYLALSRGDHKVEPSAAGAGPAPPAPSRAAPPRPGPGARLFSFARAVKYLFLERALEIRANWAWSLILGLLMPTAMVFGLARIGSGLSDRQSLLFIISGSAVFAAASEGVMAVAQIVGLMRENGMIVYYAALPISKASFTMAMSLSRFLTILPGLLTPVIVGRLLYDIDVEVSLWLLLILPLTSLSLAGLGVSLGFLLPNMDLINLITNLIVFVLLLGAPVLIPPEALPEAIRVIGFAFPPTYAAEAIRLVLDGEIGRVLYRDIGILTAFMVFFYSLVLRSFGWRLKGGA